MVDEETKRNWRLNACLSRAYSVGYKVGSLEQKARMTTDANEASLARQEVRRIFGWKGVV